MKKPGLLIISNTDSTFVSRDVELLSTDFAVKFYLVKQRKDIFGFIGSFVKSFIFLAVNIWQYQAILCWFADYHSLLPAFFSRLGNKKIFLIEGGYDTTYLKDYNYGVYSSRFRTFCATYAMRYATINLPVSNFLKKELPEYARQTAKVIPTGYDANWFNSQEKNNEVICLAGVNSEKRLKIKGVDRVISVAKLLPEVNFRIIGVDRGLWPNLETLENVEILPMLNETETRDQLAVAKVCVVFSVREGLPNVVFEAMLSRCTVIGLNHSGLAEAIDGHGVLLKEWQLEAASVAIRDALSNPADLEGARQYVIDNFSLEHRRHRLVEILKAN